MAVEDQDGDGPQLVLQDGDLREQRMAFAALGNLQLQTRGSPDQAVDRGGQLDVLLGIEGGRDMAVRAGGLTRP